LTGTPGQGERRKEKEKMTLKTLSGKYSREEAMYREENERIETKIAERENQIERLKKKQERLWKTRPFWIDYLVKPVADYLLTYLPGRRYEILGPFGLGAVVSIHFYKLSATKENQFENDNCKSITFVPGDLGRGELRIRNHDEDTGE